MLVVFTVSQVVELLSKQPDFAIEFPRFIPLYHHQYRKQVRVADFGFTKLIDLFDAIPHIAKVCFSVQNSNYMFVWVCCL